MCRLKRGEGSGQLGDEMLDMSELVLKPDNERRKQQSANDQDQGGRQEHTQPHLPTGAVDLPAVCGKRPEDFRFAGKLRRIPLRGGLADMSVLIIILDRCFSDIWRCQRGRINWRKTAWRKSPGPRFLPNSRGSELLLMCRHPLGGSPATAEIQDVASLSDTVVEARLGNSQ